MFRMAVWDEEENKFEVNASWMPAIIGCNPSITGAVQRVLDTSGLKEEDIEKAHALVVAETCARFSLVTGLEAMLDSIKQLDLTNENRKSSHPAD